MERKEFNNKLKKELAISVEQGENTEKLIELYNKLATFISNSDRYKFIDNDLKVLAIGHAIQTCIKHGIKFNPEKSDDAYAYMTQIMRGSFAGTMLKNYKKKYRMSKEEFDEFIHEVIPQQLFHVEPMDIDDETGGSLQEVILVGLIANRPSCLKYKSLQWFLDYFLYPEKDDTK